VKEFGTDPSQAFPGHGQPALDEGWRERQLQAKRTTLLDRQFAAERPNQK